MKRQPAIFMLIIFLISSQEIAFSQKIYVSPAGTDSNPEFDPDLARKFDKIVTGI